MPFRICKSLEIENGHMLAKHPEQVPLPARPYPQGRVCDRGRRVDENEMVCDFKIVKETVGEWLDPSTTRCA